MRFFVFLFALVCGSIRAQIGMGEWRLHVVTSKAIDIAQNEQYIFTAYENGLSVLNISDESHELYTALNGLSDIEISCIFFDEVEQALFIGYENGNIDKFKNDRFYNIPALKLANVPNSKRINRFTRAGNFVLAANDFSILKIDPIKNEVKETFYPTNSLEQIQDVVHVEDTLFALTPSRLLKGNINNPALPDASQWEIDQRLPANENKGIYKELERFNDQLVVLFDSQIMNTGDTVYALSYSKNKVVTNLPWIAQINSIQEDDNQLFVSTNGECAVYNLELKLVNIYSAANFDKQFKFNRSIKNQNGLWVADNNWGLVNFASELDYRLFSLSGPKNRSFYSMDWQKDKLIIASGSLSGKQPTFSKNGIHYFQDKSWKIKKIENTPEWENKYIWDFLDVSINPKNTDEIAICTYSFEPISIINNTKTTCFDPSNSTIQPTSLGNDWSLVSDVTFDEDGNLWSLNGYTEKPLNVLDKNKNWKNFDCGFQARNKFTTKMIIDFNNIIWFSVLDEGLFGYNHNGTIDDESDDQYKQITSGAFTGDLPSSNVTAIAADFNGEIWIGTDAGFAILYNASNVFNANLGEYNAQRIKINFEGNVEYLLGSTHITDIEVDGGNRKWMATANAGLILLSADGNEILETLTTENSPLISNVIYDIKLNQETGELFIITDKGLVSYRTNASYEDPEYANTIVFPNPVRPNYFGPVTIQGIRYDSDVKITDVAGNLIYKTTSNGGTATWNGKTLNGQKVASGVYFIWTATNEGNDKKVGKVLVIN
jgi:hypothetical protein